MESKAVARYIRISPRKARLVVDTIRGRDLDEAQQILDFSDRAAARVVSKVLRSAAANAENNNGLSPDSLFVSRAFVDEGPTLKRFRPRAMGRATRINKRTCHITVILDEREPEKVSPKKRRIRKAATAARAAVTRSKAEQAEEEELEVKGEEKQAEKGAKKAAAKPAAGKATAGKAARKPAAKPAEDLEEAAAEELEALEDLEEDTDIEQAEETGAGGEEAEEVEEAADKPANEKSEE
ncbi:MAG: 50S ribosomal protein L22 [Candidatus Geothermincolia bacterium]